MTISTKRSQWRQWCNGFDIFILAGATVNLLVVVLLVTYWLLH